MISISKLSMQIAVEYIESRSPKLAAIVMITQSYF